MAYRDYYYTQPNTFVDLSVDTHVDTYVDTQVPTQVLTKPLYRNFTKTNTNTPTQDFKDINSLADVILGTFGDMNRMSIGGIENIPILNIIPGTLTWFNNQIIKPIAQGYPGAVALNILQGFGEDIDAANNIIKGIATEGLANGLANNFALNGEGRKTYYWNTGNLALDFACEVLTDPLTWAEIGAVVATWLTPIPGDEIVTTGAVASHLTSKFAKFSAKQADDIAGALVKSLDSKSTRALARTVMYRDKDMFINTFNKRILKNLDIPKELLKDKSFNKALTNVMYDAFYKTMDVTTAPAIKFLQSSGRFADKVGKAYVKTLFSPIYVPYKLNKKYHLIDNFVNNRLVKTHLDIPRTTQLNTIDIFDLDSVEDYMKSHYNQLKRTTVEGDLPTEELTKRLINEELSEFVDMISTKISELPQTEALSEGMRAQIIHDTIQEVFNVDADTAFKVLLELSENADEKTQKLIFSLINSFPEVNVNAHYKLRGHIKTINKELQNLSLKTLSPKDKIRAVHNIVLEHTGMEFDEFLQYAKTVDKGSGDYLGFIDRLSPYENLETLEAFNKVLADKADMFKNIETRKQDTQLYFNTFSKEEKVSFIKEHLLPVIEGSGDYERKLNFVKKFLQDIGGFEEFEQDILKALNSKDIDRIRHNLTKFKNKIKQAPSVDYKNNPLAKYGDYLFATRNIVDNNVQYAQRKTLIEHLINNLGKADGVFEKQSEFQMFETIVRRLLPEDFTELTAQYRKTHNLADDVIINPSDLYLERLSIMKSQSDAYTELYDKFKKIKDSFDAYSDVQKQRLKTHIGESVSGLVKTQTENIVKLEIIEEAYTHIHTVLDIFNKDITTLTAPEFIKIGKFLTNILEKGDVSKITNPYIKELLKILKTHWHESGFKYKSYGKKAFNKIKKRGFDADYITSFRAVQNKLKQILNNLEAQEKSIKHSLDNSILDVNQLPNAFKNKNVLDYKLPIDALKKVAKASGKDQNYIIDVLQKTSISKRSYNFEDIFSEEKELKEFIEIYKDEDSLIEVLETQLGIEAWADIDAFQGLSIVLKDISELTYSTTHKELQALQDSFDEIISKVKQFITENTEIDEFLSDDFIRNLEQIKQILNEASTQTDYSFKALFKDMPEEQMALLKNLSKTDNIIEYLHKNYSFDEILNQLDLLEEPNPHILGMFEKVSLKALDDIHTLLITDLHVLKNKKNPYTQELTNILEQFHDKWKHIKSSADTLQSSDLDEFTKDFESTRDALQTFFNNLNAKKKHIKQSADNVLSPSSVTETVDKITGTKINTFYEGTQAWEKTIEELGLTDLFKSISNLDNTTTLETLRNIRASIDTVFSETYKLGKSYEGFTEIFSEIQNVLYSVYKTLSDTIEVKDPVKIVLSRDTKIFTPKLNNVYLMNWFLSAEEGLFNKEIPKVLKWLEDIIKDPTIDLGESEIYFNQLQQSLTNTLTSVLAYKTLANNLDAIDTAEVPAAIKTIILDVLAYKYYLNPKDIIDNADNYVINDILKSVRKQIDALGVNIKLSMDSWRARIKGHGNVAHIAKQDVKELFERAATDFDYIENNPVISKFKKYSSNSDEYHLIGFDFETTGVRKEVNEISESAFKVWGTEDVIQNTRQTKTFLNRNALEKMYIKPDDVNRLEKLNYLNEKGPQEFIKKYIYPNAVEQSEFVVLKPLLDSILDGQAKGKKVVLMSANGDNFDVPFLKHKLKQALNAKEITQEVYWKYFNAIQNSESFDIVKDYRNMFNSLKLSENGEYQIKEYLAEYLRSLTKNGATSGIVQLFDGNFTSSLRYVKSFMDNTFSNIHSNTGEILTSFSEKYTNDIRNTLTEMVQQLSEKFKVYKQVNKDLSRKYINSHLFDIDDITTTFGSNLSQVFYCTLRDGVVTVNADLHKLGFYSYNLDDIVKYFSFDYGDAMLPHQVKYYGAISKSINKNIDAIKDVSILHTKHNTKFIKDTFTKLQEAIQNSPKKYKDSLLKLRFDKNNLNVYEQFAILRTFKNHLDEADIIKLDELYTEAHKHIYTFDITPAEPVVSKNYTEFFQNKFDNTNVKPISTDADSFKIEKYTEVFSEESFEKTAEIKVKREKNLENFGEKIDSFVERYADTNKYNEELDEMLCNFSDFTGLEKVHNDINNIRAARVVSHTIAKDTADMVSTVKGFYSDLSENNKYIWLKQQWHYGAKLRYHQTMQNLDLLINPQHSIEDLQAHLFFNAHRLQVIPVKDYITDNTFRNNIDALLKRKEELALHNIFINTNADQSVIYVTLGSNYKVNRISQHNRNVQYFVNGKEIFRPNLKGIDFNTVCKVDWKDAVDDSVVTKSLINTDTKLNKLTNGKHLGTAYENVSREFYVKLYEHLPDEVRATLPGFSEFTDERFFTNFEYNHSILGNSEFRNSFGDLLRTDENAMLLFSHPNLITGLTENVAKAYNMADKKIQVINYLLDDSVNLLNGNAWKNFTDEQLFEMLKSTDDYTVAVLAKRNLKILAKEGDNFADFKLSEFKINTVKDVAKAREIGASIIPAHVYDKAYNVVNEFEYIEGAMGTLFKVTNLFKMGYLMSAGNVVRNTVDEFIKNARDTDGIGSAAKSLIETVGTYRQYKKITQAILKAYDEVSSETIQKYFTEIYQGPAHFNQDMFTLIYNFFEDGPIGQIDELMQQRLKGIELTAYGRITKAAQVLLEPTSEVDRIMRLSEFMWASKHGYTTLDAYRLVEQTHFAFNKKSEAELMAEIIFPFYGFTLDNLHYWLDTIEKHPEYIRHYFKLQNASVNSWDPTGEKRKYNMSFQTAIANGQIIVGKNGETLKAAPSFFDVIQLFTNPSDYLNQKLAGFIKEPINAVEHVVKQEPYTAEDLAQTASNLVPIIGPLPQRVLTAKRNYERTGNVLNAVLPSVFGAIKPKQTTPKKKYAKKKYVRTYNSYWVNSYYNRFYRKYYSYDKYYSYPKKYYAQPHWKSLPKRGNYRSLRNVYYDLYTKKGKSRFQLLSVPTSSYNLKYNIAYWQRYWR